MELQLSNKIKNSLLVFFFTKKNKELRNFKKPSVLTVHDFLKYLPATKLVEVIKGNKYVV